MNCKCDMIYPVMPAGRPIESVPQDKANEILAWVANGKPLREYCRIEGNPAFRTVYDWLKKDAQFSALYACARESGEDQIAQECLEISDEAPLMTTSGDNGKGGTWEKTQIDPGAIQRNRLRVDTRLKLLAKWNPKKYGERIEHTGEIGIKTILLPAAHREALPRPDREPEFLEE